MNYNSLYMKNRSLNTSLQLVEINVKNLRIGMYVSRLDRDWLDSSFLFQGFELKNEIDIQEVQRQCHYVYIDVYKQSNKQRGSTISKKTAYSNDWVERRKAPRKETDFENEIVNAEHVFYKTSRLIKSFMEEVSLGRAINIEIAKKAVSECVQSVINAPDALMWLTQLKNRDEYTSQHSMNVCIFSIALARHLDLPIPELIDVGLCGLMHDMGKLKIPLEILNKPGRFEPEELKIMQSHPLLGLQILESDHALPRCVIEAVYGHHERIDGKGYPRKLTGNKIHAYTRIISIADTYDAISSDRIYKKGKTHLESINILTKSSGTQLDTELVIKFIQCLGIYPPGNVVELNTGEVAIIIEVNQVKKLRPKITLLLNKDKIPVKPRLVDLAKIEKDTNGEPYLIRRMVNAEDFNINVNQLYKMGLVQT